MLDVKIAPVDAMMHGQTLSDDSGVSTTEGVLLDALSSSPDDDMVAGHIMECTLMCHQLEWQKETIPKKLENPKHEAFANPIHFITAINSIKMLLRNQYPFKRTKILNLLSFFCILLQPVPW